MGPERWRKQHKPFRSVVTSFFVSKTIRAAPNNKRGTLTTKLEVPRRWDEQAKQGHHTAVLAFYTHIHTRSQENTARQWWRFNVRLSVITHTPKNATPFNWAPFFPVPMEYDIKHPKQNNRKISQTSTVPRQNILIEICLKQNYLPSFCSKNAAAAAADDDVDDDDSCRDAYSSPFSTQKKKHKPKFFSFSAVFYRNLCIFNTNQCCRIVYGINCTENLLQIYINLLNKIVKTVHTHPLITKSQDNHIAILSIFLQRF